MQSTCCYLWRISFKFSFFFTTIKHMWWQFFFGFCIALSFVLFFHVLVYLHYRNFLICFNLCTPTKSRSRTAIILRTADGGARNRGLKVTKIANQHYNSKKIQEKTKGAVAKPNNNASSADLQAADPWHFLLSQQKGTSLTWWAKRSHPIFKKKKAWI